MSAKLEIRNLVKRFGGLTATNNVSFTVHPGESIGLIGPNGAGKTTIFSQIMGEHKQNEGDIVLDDREISGWSTPQRVRRGLSRTYQIPRPFGDMSVSENIRVGLMPDSVWQMISRSANHEREADIALSVGLTRDQLDKNPTELSMGDLRKLEMARTLATSPKIVLLDEVFAGLTVGEISVISQLVQSLQKDGMTFLIVSHDLKALEPLISRAIAIDQGTLIAEGSYAEVIRDPQVRASYLGGEA